MDGAVEGVASSELYLRQQRAQHHQHRGEADHEEKVEEQGLLATLVGLNGDDSQQGVHAYKGSAHKDGENDVQAGARAPCWTDMQRVEG